MSKKLFVGGLAWATTDESLRKAFEKVGEVVSASVILDRETGRSRGFGFVVFADEQTAQTALGAMQGADVDGRRIRLDLATDGPGGGRRDGPPGERPAREPPRYPPVERRGPGGEYTPPPRREWSAAPPRRDFSPPPPPLEPAPRWEGEDEGRERAARRREKTKKRETRKDGERDERDWPRAGKRAKHPDPLDTWDEDED